MLVADLQAARVHPEPTPKLYVFKFHAEWLVVDMHAGLVKQKCRTWAESLEVAQTIITAALTAEVCS